MRPRADGDACGDRLLMLNLFSIWLPTDSIEARWRSGGRGKEFRVTAAMFSSDYASAFDSVTPERLPSNSISRCIQQTSLQQTG